MNLIRNIGQFDSIAPGAQYPFARLSLVYAENGRGKTTLSAILRSLSTGNPQLIIERNRLGAIHPPHVVITISGTQHQFQNGSWDTTFPQITVFDDSFVAQNVCSGLDVDTEHRQNLHELIIGAQGVVLNQALQTHVGQIEQHNRRLREIADAIPHTVQSNLSVEAFCALPADPNIDGAIREAERNLAAAQSADAIRQHPELVQLQLPSFNLDSIDEILGRSLANLNTEAISLVQAHLSMLGNNGERWVAEGMQMLEQGDQCPFCSQGLAGIQLIQNYQAYFSEAYDQLKIAIQRFNQSVMAAHGGSIQAAFERSIRVAIETRTFWQPFLDIPEINIDTAAIARDWTVARDHVQRALAAKQSAPLERLTLSEDARSAVQNYEVHRLQIEALSTSLIACNPQIAIIREQAAASNIIALTNDLTRLRVVRDRHTAPLVDHCAEYLAEQAAKETTEQRRDQARAALDQYRRTIFPAYEQSINKYLHRFSAGFRLGSVSSINTRTGSSSTYNVLINNIQVPLMADTGPSFRNTLSAGDRNTLALAFFFASLERDTQLAQKIVVIDDPMTSLDEHRALTTVQEISRLIPNVKQLLILSHSKPFLCAIWEEADRTSRSAIRISRDGQGSTILDWDVSQDSITEHDRHHALVSNYLNTADPAEERNVAEALRHILEAFVRVAYPNLFPPCSTLGPFIDRCQQSLSQPSPIMSANNVTELRDLLDYANRFHHDTNPAWQTELINDHELVQHCQRTLAFTRRT